MSKSAPAFYVIYDTISNTFAMNGRFGVKTLNECLARYARTVGAQKEITRMESHGNDMRGVVIFPVSLITGNAIKPKLRAKKSGFAIKFVETYKDYWTKKNKTRTSYWKGNKKILPRTVDQITAEQKAAYDEKRYIDRDSEHVLAKHRNSALWLGYYDLFGKHVDSTVSATVFPTKAAAEAHLNIMLKNLVAYQNEYDPGSEHESNTNNRNNTIERTKISIVSVK